MCNSAVKDEINFVCEFPEYTDFRQPLFQIAVWGGGGGGVKHNRETKKKHK